MCEGVETFAEAEVLVGAGTALLPGYFYGRARRDLVVPVSAQLHSGHFPVRAEASKLLAAV